MIKSALKLIIATLNQIESHIISFTILNTKAIKAYLILLMSNFSCSQRYIIIVQIINYEKLTVNSKFPYFSKSFICAFLSKLVFKFLGDEF